MTRAESTRGDPRVQRTRNLIVEALIELTIQKGFAAVSVQDIAKRAGINRATFYRHFQDKFDLLDQYAQDVYELPDSVPDSGSPAGADGATEKTVAGLARMLEHIHRHSKFFRVMLGKNGDPAFADKIRLYIQKRIQRSLPNSLLADEDSSGLYLSYVSSGTLGVLSWWLEHDMPYSSEQLAAATFRLIVADLTMRKATS